MGDVHDQREAYWWSMARIAEALGMDRKTVSKRIRMAGVEPAGQRGGYFVYDIQPAFRAIFGGPPGEEPAGELDLESDPLARRAWWQSQNEKLRFERALRRLIPSEDHARQLAIFAKGIIGELPTLPQHLAEAGLPQEAVEIAAQVIDAATEQLQPCVELAEGLEDERE